MKLNKLVHRLEDVLESYSTAITTSLHDSKGSYQLSLLHEATRQERKHCPKQLRRRSRHRFTTVTAAVKCHDLHLLDSRSCSRRFVQCALWLLQNAAPTPLGTHEHSRVRFSILTPGQGPQPGSPVRDPEIEAGFCHVKFFS